MLPLLWLSGCGASLDDYRGSQPGWDLARFFNGKLVAHGLVTDRSGEVTSRFRVEMQGHWQDGKGELLEQFYFDDGRRQTRTWFLSKGRMVTGGTAADVVGRPWARRQALHSTGVISWIWRCRTGRWCG